MQNTSIILQTLIFELAIFITSQLYIFLLLCLIIRVYINQSVSLLYNVILINEIPKANPRAVENPLNKSIFKGLKA